MIQAEVQEYGAQAASTETFGRVLCSARKHYSSRAGHEAGVSSLDHGAQARRFNPGSLEEGRTLQS